MSDPDKTNGLKKLIPSLRDLVRIEPDFRDIILTLKCTQYKNINLISDCLIEKSGQKLQGTHFPEVLSQLQLAHLCSFKPKRFLAAIAALYVTVSVSQSEGWSVRWSVGRMVSLLLVSKFNRMKRQYMV